MSESMAQGMVLTLADKHKLESELNMLKTVKKAEVTRDIAEARAHGDLSENAEYDEAKNEEARVQGRIVQLEEMLANATIVDEDDASTDVVSLGTVVTVYDMEYDEEDEYTIVGFTESDPSKLFISGESPIGAALMGAHVGDIVEANTPGGIVKMQVKEIKRR
ncbi:MAG: transcription elongation factor GreA [Clostridia bacterium]|jgi:transcription elongation factor GreA|nr:transcription elongation factor GreA [Clostridia bacterium]MBR5379489.1 transcription elongation factor GreA [Clostridia bacterium]MBR5751057.1 transcription elongation factor GreA [Clostridia bacterium]